MRLATSVQLLSLCLSVQAFSSTPSKTAERTPPHHPSSLRRPCSEPSIVLLAAKDSNDKEQEKSGGIRRFIGKVLSDDKEQDGKKKDKSKDGTKDDGGLLKGITKRFSGGGQKPAETEEKKRWWSRKDKELQEDEEAAARRAAGPVTLAFGALEAVEGSVQELRSQIGSVRSSEVPDDSGTNGLLLSKEDEKKRLKEIRQRQKDLRIKEQKEEAARQEARRKLEKEQEEARKAAIQAKQRLDAENKERARKQKEQQALQRKVKEAAQKPSTGEVKLSVPQQASNSTKSKLTFGAVGRLVSSMMESKEEEWVAVFPKSRLDPGEVVPVNIGGIDLLVIASVSGKELYCIANSCPHLGTPLETGLLRRKPVKGSTSPDGMEDCITCPLHETAFRCDTGEVQGEWCPYPPILGAIVGAVKTKQSVAIFDIRTKGKNVEVRINSSLDPNEKKANKS